MNDPAEHHIEKIAITCKHTLHFSAPLRTLYCPQCTMTAAQADLEKARKNFEAEGGADASSYKRDRA